VDAQARRVMKAFTRAVSPKLPECALTHLDRTPIDVAKAIAQHAAYEQALADAGCEVIRLPELPDDPDAVFVEDTALLLDGHAVITLPGVASRAGETESSAAGLAANFELHRIASGFLDGGDVLRIGRTLYVGVSSRNEPAAANCLRLTDRLILPAGNPRTADRLRERGFEVIEVDVSELQKAEAGVTCMSLIDNRA
jgi:dimethylargininase